MQKAKAQAIDREELARRLLALGRKKLKLEQIEAEMQAEIDDIKEQFSDRLERRASTVESMAQRLRLSCEDSRDELLTGRKKSVDTIFGTIGWRKQGERVRTQDGVSTTEAAQRLIDRGFDDLVRRKPKPAKSSIKKAVNDGRLSEDELHRIGLEISGGDEDWWYEINRESVAEEIESE